MPSNADRSLTIPQEPEYSAGSDTQSDGYSKVGMLGDQVALGDPFGSINPRSHQPPVPIPEGFNREQILATLSSFALDGQPSQELVDYAREDCDRFLYTLDLVPTGELHLLEVGANPYFTTYLLKMFRPQAHLQLLNYFGGDVAFGSQTVMLTGLDGVTNEEHRFDFVNLNLELHDLSFGERQFDVVLYCEVIEHLTMDPVRTLLALKKILKPDGFLILTTPNVARLENVARLIAGANLYDPYSGHGPYGRHNREYNHHELYHLMAFCGFSEDKFFTADVHENHASRFIELEHLRPLLTFRAADLGQYLFGRWRNSGEPPVKKPAWLYRSYPQGELDPQKL